MILALRHEGLIAVDDNMCHGWVMLDGEKIRERTPLEQSLYFERGGRCKLGCERRCQRDDPADPAASKWIRDWRVCGGKKRFCWPEPGSLQDQRALTVFVFGLLDELPLKES